MEQTGRCCWVPSRRPPGDAAHWAPTAGLPRPVIPWSDSGILKGLQGTRKESRLRSLFLFFLTWETETELPSAPSAPQMDTRTGLNPAKAGNSFRVSQRVAGPSRLSHHGRLPACASAGGWSPELRRGVRPSWGVPRPHPHTAFSLSLPLQVTQYLNSRT